MTPIKTEIIVKDHLRLHDKIGEPENYANLGLKGHLTFRDPLTGEVILEKDNLVTLRLRSFVLELLFGMNTNAGINNTNRKICLFKIGSGGADLTASPLEAIAPKVTDTELYNPIPFVITSSLKETIPEYQANPSILESLTEEQTKIYYLPQEQPDGSVRYYGKRFEEDSERIKYDTNNGVVYWHGSCRITAEEARGFVLNELGLVFAEYDEATNSYSDVELATHVTFASNALLSLNNGVLIEYLLYA